VYCPLYPSIRHTPEDADKADAQKVVTIITGDNAKTQTYCEIQKSRRTTAKMADELSEKIEKLEETLGSDYVALIDGLQDIDPKKDKLGRDMYSRKKVATLSVPRKSPHLAQPSFAYV
jgi:hypothetical protein